MPEMGLLTLTRLKERPLPVERPLLESRPGRLIRTALARPQSDSSVALVATSQSSNTAALVITYVTM